MAENLLSPLQKIITTALGIIGGILAFLTQVYPDTLRKYVSSLFGLSDDLVVLSLLFTIGMVLVIVAVVILGASLFRKPKAEVGKTGNGGINLSIERHEYFPEEEVRIEGSITSGAVVNLSINRQGKTVLGNQINAGANGQFKFVYRLEPNTPLGSYEVTATSGQKSLSSSFTVVQSS